MEIDLPPRPRLSYLLRVLHLQYSQEVAAALHDAGFGDLRPGNAKVFPFVPREGITVGDLATIAGVRKQTMAESVEHLERTGYLERRPNPHDARSRLLFLTKRGEAARPVAMQIGALVEQRWAKATSPQDIEELRDRLRHLLIAVAPADGPEAVDAAGRPQVHPGRARRRAGR